MKLAEARIYILEKLSNLSTDLYYHGIHHVLDVENAATILARGEGIIDRQSLIMLQTAALYHDSGFLHTYKDHEEAGCAIVRSILPEFDYGAKQIEVICGMIMATKIPQSPQNHLEQIICDADLDYLGRDDFEPIADTLFRELMALNFVLDLNSWNKIQVSFLKSHHFWTNTAKSTRDSSKRSHLAKLVEMCEENAG